MLKRFGQRLVRRKRFNLAALLFVLLIAAFSVGGAGLARAIVLAFAIASAAFLTAVAWMFSHSDGASIRARARKEDEGRWGLLLSGVAVTVVVLVALGLELNLDKGAGGAFGIVLAAVSLLLSWLFMNTMFALHYAHAYYGDNQHNEPRGGLEFPGEKDPDYWDFVYFALVIGMTFQVSDVQICARPMRHIALLHAVIAFFFNVIIIALTINIVAGKV
jgi:uncharacterized membrane protein